MGGAFLTDDSPSPWSAGQDRLGDLIQVDLDHGGVLRVGIGLHQLGIGQPGLHRLDAARQAVEHTGCFEPYYRDDAMAFIDWLRNRPGASIVAPYSLRPLPSAPVAAARVGSLPCRACW
mgnify:CR=1 FL=1